MEGDTGELSRTISHRELLSVEGFRERHYSRNKKRGMKMARKNQDKTGFKKYAGEVIAASRSNDDKTL